MINVGNEVMRGSYTSGVMRLASNLLLNLCKEKVEKVTPQGCSKTRDLNGMWDYIRPQHFDRCVKAALAAAFQDGDDSRRIEVPVKCYKDWV